jgi:hypothetical protein
MQSRMSKPTFQMCILPPSSVPWWWRQYVRLKWQYTSLGLCGATSQKAIIFIFTTMKTWNVTKFNWVHKLNLFLWNPCNIIILKKKKKKKTQFPKQSLFPSPKCYVHFPFPQCLTLSVMHHSLPTVQQSQNHADKLLTPESKFSQQPQSTRGLNPLFLHDKG